MCVQCKLHVRICIINEMKLLSCLVVCREEIMTLYLFYDHNHIHWINRLFLHVSLIEYYSNSSLERHIPPQVYSPLIL
jgi:hypothetical protein